MAPTSDPGEQVVDVIANRKSDDAPLVGRGGQTSVMPIAAREAAFSSTSGQRGPSPG